MSEKKLGFGLMRLPLTDPEQPTSIDHEHLCRMVDTFLEKGFTYFDTAWMYCGFSSEKAIRRALVERHPRESYTLATKLHVAYVKCDEDKDRIFNTQLENTGAGYFDYYLLHSMGAQNYEDYEKYDCFRWVMEKKRQGLVKRVGLSFHDTADVLDRILTDHPEMEFVQLQINYLDWESEDVQSRKCYEVACRHNKPVIVMEPVKGGTLATLSPAAAAPLQAVHPAWSSASWAVRFAASLPAVFMVLSGMSNMEQMLDNTAALAETPVLTQEEQAALAETVAVLSSAPAIPCTGCAYCVDGCPMSIPIPRCFSLYNEDQQLYGGKGDWTPPMNYYESVTAGGKTASACIACGACVDTCPQHLDIPSLMKTVAARFE